MKRETRSILRARLVYSDTFVTIEAAEDILVSDARQRAEIRDRDLRLRTLRQWMDTWGIDVTEAANPDLVRLFDLSKPLKKGES